MGLRQLRRRAAWKNCIIDLIIVKSPLNHRWWRSLALEGEIPRFVTPHLIRGLDKRDNEESRVTPLLSNYVTNQSPPLLTLYNQKYKNALRSEERRVGKECVSTLRTR